MLVYLFCVCLFSAVFYMPIKAQRFSNSGRLLCFLFFHFMFKTNDSVDPDESSAHINRCTFHSSQRWTEMK